MTMAKRGIVDVGNSDYVYLTTYDDVDTAAALVGIDRDPQH